MRNCRARKHRAKDRAEISRAPPADAPRAARRRGARGQGRTVVRDTFEKANWERPASIPSAFFSALFAGFFAAGGFVRQLREQGDGGGAGADQETLALELNHGDEAAVAKSGGFANGELLALVASTAEQCPPNRGVPENLETAEGERQRAREDACRNAGWRRVGRRAGLDLCLRDFHLGQLHRWRHLG